MSDPIAPPVRVTSTRRTIATCLVRKTNSNVIQRADAFGKNGLTMTETIAMTDQMNLNGLAPTVDLDALLKMEMGDVFRKPTFAMVTLTIVIGREVILCGT